MDTLGQQNLKWTKPAGGKQNRYTLKSHNVSNKTPFLQRHPKKPHHSEWLYRTHHITLFQDTISKHPSMAKQQQIRASPLTSCLWIGSQAGQDQKQNAGFHRPQQGFSDVWNMISLTSGSFPPLVYCHYTFIFCCSKYLLTACHQPQCSMMILCTQVQ